jgi:hypothetical protein
MMTTSSQEEAAEEEEEATEEEEVEEEAAIEEAETDQETMLAPEEEDRIQRKHSKKLKKISQPYEREDHFDLRSKELADSAVVFDKDLTPLKRFTLVRAFFINRPLSCLILFCF